MPTSTFLKRTFLAVAVCAMLSLFTPNLFAAAGGTADELAPYKALAKQALQLVTAGNMSGAVKKGAEIEEKWDANTLGGQFPDIDQQMDVMNDALKSGNAKKATTEINKYLNMLDSAAK